MNCIYLAQRTRDYLDKNCKKLDLHLNRRFPHGSCETSSLVLGKVLSDAFPEKVIFWVKGTNSSEFEMHFWVEAEGVPFDITADQFEGIIEPLYGKPSNIISDRFDQVEKIPIFEALQSNNYATSCRDLFNIVSSEIRGKTLQTCTNR